MSSTTTFSTLMRDLDFEYARTVPPSAINLAVTLEQVKAEIGLIDDDSQDDRIRSLIRTVTEWIEEDAGRIVMSQTWRLYLDRFPSDIIEIKRFPITSLSHVKYYSDDVLTTWSSASYQADIISAPARLWPISGEYWPTADTGKLHAVQIEFIAGYASAATVPNELQYAILHAVNQAYNNCGVAENYRTLIRRIRKFGYVA